MAYDDSEKERLKPYLIPYLEAKGVKLRRQGNKQVALCPFHQEKTPSFNVSDDNLFHCFGCDVGGDIFTAIEKLEGIVDFPKKIDFARTLVGGARPTSAPIRKMVLKQERPIIDYTEYYRKARAARGDTDYWTRRGFTEDTLKAFGVGYDPNWVNPETKGKYKIQAAIIPNNPNCYIAKDIRPGKHPYNVGGVALFNPQGLRAKEPVIVAEAAIDAMTFFQIRPGQVTAINGTSNWRLLINALTAMGAEKRPPIIIIAMDNDEAGRGATENIISGGRDGVGLKKLGIPYKIFNRYGGNDE